MFEISGTQITLTRGDSFTGVFPMYVDGELYELEEGDKCFFSVKQDPEDDDPVVGPKKLTDYVLELEPNDTQGLEFGKYWYDVYIVFADGKRLTYLTKARLVIDKEAHT